MKKISMLLVLSFLGSSVFAQVGVSGYTRQDGTYVQPHMRSAPDNTTLNNYSTRGNINPYTGEPGTKSPYPQVNPYQQPVQQVRPAQMPPVQQIQPAQAIKPFQPLQPIKTMPNPNGF